MKNDRSSRSRDGFTLLQLPVVRKCGPKGFTLIELLVVIAIIALLVALLMPSLREAKELTRRAVCASNLHHLGVGVMTYAADFDGYPPPQYCVYITDPSRREYDGKNYLGDWCSAILGPHVYDHSLGEYSEFKNGWTDYFYVTPWWKAMESYATGPELLMCPSSKYGRQPRTEGNWFGYNSYHWFGWTFNNVQMGYYAGIDQKEKRLTYGHDLLMSDMVLDTWYGPSWYDINHWDKGHVFAEGSNHLYVGGGVTWVDGADLEKSNDVRGRNIWADYPNQ